MIVKPVLSASDWDQFFKLPQKIYKGDPYWVSPVQQSTRAQLNVAKNPFFRHAFMGAFLAYEHAGSNVAIGRVVVVIDENHNRFHRENVAFFGFFEAMPAHGATVTQALLKECEAWAFARGMKTLRGPVNLSTNHECGLLISGGGAKDYHDIPSIMMTYNLPAYQGWIESLPGYQKSKDLFAYEIEAQTAEFSERLLAQSERLKQSGRVTFRQIKLTQWNKEIELLLDLYNDAWEKNWGFVPMDRAEFFEMAEEMRWIMDPSLVLICEVAGETAGFGLALPDINELLHGNRSGALAPALGKLIWHLKARPALGLNSGLRRCRIITLGMRRVYNRLGLGPLLYTEYLKRCRAAGYAIGEASWILEDNHSMNKALARMGAVKTKTYRLYDKLLLTS